MLRILIPFFYFRATRLKEGRSWLFHASYEWVPGVALAFIWGEERGAQNFFLSYLAFISIYELGYVMNDELSHRREGERQRHERQSPTVLALFVIIRLAAFGLLVDHLDQWTNGLMMYGYVTLAVAFLCHNLLRSVSVKCLTFLVLSYLRFMLPLAPWLTPTLVLQLTTPVLLNYSLFRLLIYMDSKHLLSGLDRRSPTFLITFYAVTMVFGSLLTYVSGSWLPAGFTLYYLGLAVSMSLTLSLRR